MAKVDEKRAGILIHFSSRAPAEEQPKREAANGTQPGRMRCLTILQPTRPRLVKLRPTLG